MQTTLLKQCSNAKGTERTKAIGIGSGGCNIVNCATNALSMSENISFYTFDTPSSCGKKPELGKKIVADIKGAIETLFDKETELLIIVSTLGGGMGIGKYTKSSIQQTRCSTSSIETIVSNQNSKTIKVQTKNSWFKRMLRCLRTKLLSATNKKS